MTQARHRVLDYARAVGADTNNVGLAVTEAFNNSVVHGLRGEGEVEVEAWMEEGDLLVRVSDQGVGLRPDLGSRGAGFGLPLIGAVTSQVQFDTSASGLRVTMRFPCP